MRIKTSLTGRGHIPFNYNLALAGAVYGAVKRANTELASQIHSSTECKYFTFSLLQVPERKISSEGIYVVDGCSFLVSSPVKEVIQSFVEGILERPEVRIGGVRFEVESVEVTRSPEFDGGCVFSTLSPIIVRTMEEGDGRKRIVDLYPTDAKFYENLKTNLVRKYVRLYGEERGDVTFSVPFSTKFMRIQIKETFHRASLMKFEVRGDRELLRLGYEAGFGEKNSMGFGMVKVIRNYEENGLQKDDAAGRVE